MAEAADTIADLRVKVASLEKSLKETQQELEREQGLNEMAADNAREQFDEDRAEYEEKIEFLETDRLRLANLIHPDTPGCDVVAGRCHWCEEVVRKHLARRELLERERNDYKRQAIAALENLEQRNAEVRELCDAVERMINDKLTAMPIEVDEQLTEALEKVRRELE